MTDTAPVPATMSPRPAAASGALAAARPQREIMQFRTIAEVMQFAEMIQHAEGAIPKHCLGKPGKIVATVMAGHELGVGPMASLRAFHVVEGKPTADYTFWIARLKAAGYRVEFPVKGPEKVTVRLTAPDGSKHEETWDKARAITAGLWNGKDNWKKYPETMLTARAVTSGGRAFAGEVMFGCYEHDEADEIVRDAEVSSVVSEPSGTVAQRVAAAAGSTISEEAAAREARAKECADMAKALGLSRDDVYLILGELRIDHADKTRRISELSREDLDRLAERLDEVASERSAKKGDGSEKGGGE